jgi:hypothetical protein
MIKVINFFKSNKFSSISVLCVGVTTILIYTDNKKQKNINSNNNNNTIIDDEFLDNKIKEVYNVKEYYNINQKLPDENKLDEIQRELLLFLIAKDDLNNNENNVNENKKLEKELKNISLPSSVKPTTTNIENKSVTTPLEKN